MKTFSQEWKMGLKLTERTKIKHEKSSRSIDSPNISLMSLERIFKSRTLNISGLSRDSSCQEMN